MKSEIDILREAAKLVCFNCRNNSPREHVCAARAIWARIAALEAAATANNANPAEASQ